MEVKVGGKPCTVNLRSDMLSSDSYGGEATIVKSPLGHGHVLKIFHESLGNQFNQGKERKFQAFPKHLPSNVISPIEDVRDARTGKFLGFSMAVVKDAEDFRILCFKKRLRQHSQEDVSRLLLKMKQTLSRLHQKGIVLGDLNWNNVLFNQGQELEDFWIDTDSYQLSSQYPCLTGTEEFLDPQLYGADFSHGVYTKENDLYAFAVMVFHALLFVHPYGGVHKKHKHLLRRAENNHSALNQDVRLPKKNPPLEVLSDEFLYFFSRIFDHGERLEIPDSLLQQKWYTCSNCKTQHMRKICPACKHVTIAPRQNISVNKSCASSHVRRTEGYFLLTEMYRGKVESVSYHDGKLRRQGHVSFTTPMTYQGHTVRLHGIMTLVGKGGNVVILSDNGVPRKKLSCDTWKGKPVFDSNSHDIFLLDEKGSIRSHLSKQPLLHALAGRTIFRVGEDIGAALVFMGQMQDVMVFDTKTYNPKKIAVPDCLGKITEARFRFFGQRCVLLLGYELNGTRMVRFTGFDANGDIFLDENHALQDSPIPCLASTLFVGTKILASTDDGVRAISIDSTTKTTDAVSLFTDTEPFVDADTRLMIGDAGSLNVADSKNVQHLRLR